ncbi:hypothetical protein LQE92_11915 [Lacrimispora sp. NSJ-141]|uniref:Uncharacterized protein n=1 Tax=Lientehia hominis TaxID=2897778 RepID=A0AAP2RLK2_9FIRM|nr:hypothetical protein [Lientehia hominis]MCD2493320.1 hypothetical protein [Lientehia hominis]
MGEKFAAKLVSNNRLDIYDGEGVMQGVHFRILPGTYESLTLENGTQGNKRKDLIIVKYEKDPETSIESVNLEVRKGTETTGTPEIPQIVTSNIRNGGTVNEMVLYIVEYNGITVTSVTKQFTEMQNIVGLESEIRELNDNLAMHRMQSFSDPTQLKLVKNTCTLIDLYNALPAYGTIAYWITSTSSKIQSEIAAQIGTTADHVYGILSLSKYLGPVGVYTFYRYDTFPEFTYIASYDGINGANHWKNFVKLSTATDIASVNTSISNTNSRLNSVKKMHAGTLVATWSGSSTSVRMFGIDTVNSWFNQKYSWEEGKAHYIIFAMNGDANTHSVHITGVNYMSGTYYAITENAAAAGMSRINYLAIHY